MVSTVGGARRRDSVLRGLEQTAGARWVMVHDLARPFVSRELALRVLGAARRSGAAVPVLPVGDTLVTAERGRVGQVLARDAVRAVQTPQAFDRDWLLEAHGQAPADWDASDDGSMVRRLGREVALVEGEAENFKITWPGDLARARARFDASREGEGGIEEMEMQLPRVGFGWDVHPLKKGRPFRLVGVELTPDFGPEGHSDGDPLSHAVADALLGAAGAGDIGMLFPDNDPRCRNMPGPDLLRETVEHLRRRGWRPTGVDAVVIVDKPKLAPHREAIRARLAEILGLHPGAVSVKGKRTEGLGGLAAGAGVGCQAVATLVGG
ncbi:MAG: 2-C-methyl-D-erythritol 2,4-cyclodiphosphate synthase [Acidobacteriota bacterium]|nr:2-C-methyl-D-erythritol 2,4-cyclodiphosphate synthase [Acidobacteriota bacterium]